MGRARPYQQLGSMLRELRLKKDLTQEEVVEAVAALESENRYWDDRTLRRYESGEIRPPRTALILTVVNALKETDPEIVNQYPGCRPLCDAQFGGSEPLRSLEGPLKPIPMDRCSR